MSGGEDQVLSDQSSTTQNSVEINDGVPGPVFGRC